MSTCGLRTRCVSIYRWAVPLVNRADSLGEQGELRFSKSQRLVLADPPGRAQLPRWRSGPRLELAALGSLFGRRSVLPFQQVNKGKKSGGTPPLEECS